MFEESLEEIPSSSTAENLITIETNKKLKDNFFRHLAPESKNKWMGGISIHMIGCEFRFYVEQFKNDLALDRDLWCKQISALTLENALPPIKYYLIQENIDAEVSGLANGPNSSNNSFNLNKMLQYTDYDVDESMEIQVHKLRRSRFVKPTSDQADNDNQTQKSVQEAEQKQEQQPAKECQQIKRNIPTDLPSIIVQAITNREKEFLDIISKRNDSIGGSGDVDDKSVPQVKILTKSDSTTSDSVTQASNITQRRKTRNDFKIKIDNKNMEPPETPSIEDSPSFLTFKSINTTTASSSSNSNNNVDGTNLVSTSSNICDNDLAVNNNVNTTSSLLTSISASNSTSEKYALGSADDLLELANMVYNNTTTTNSSKFLGDNNENKIDNEFTLVSLPPPKADETDTHIARVDDHLNDNDSGVDDEESDELISEKDHEDNVNMDDVFDHDSVVAKTISEKELLKPVVAENSDDEDDAKYNSHQYWNIKLPTLSVDDLVSLEIRNAETRVVDDRQHNLNRTQSLPLPPTTSSNINTSNLNATKRLSLRQINPRLSDSSVEPAKRDSNNFEDADESKWYNKTDDNDSNCSGATNDDIEVVRAELALTTLKRDLISGPLRFTQSILPSDLLEGYVSMQQYLLNDLDFFAAFSFPAVCLTVGRE